MRGPSSQSRRRRPRDAPGRPAILRDALLAADVVIATGGQTSLEAAACGTPAVLLALDEAQAEQAQTLARAGAAIIADGAEARARPRRC